MWPYVMMWRYMYVSSLAISTALGSDDLLNYIFFKIGLVQSAAVLSKWRGEYIDLELLLCHESTKTKSIIRRKKQKQKNKNYPFYVICL